jgi:hypothetical protein
MRPGRVSDHSSALTVLALALGFVHRRVGDLNHLINREWRALESRNTD